MFRLKLTPKLLLIPTVFAALAAYIIWSNTSIEVTKIAVTSSKLPSAFSGLRIAQISDLHNTKFGAGGRQLLQKLEQTNPDLIFLTGDIIDSYHTDVAAAVEVIRGAVQIAPTYYVTGNHESRIPEAYAQLKSAMSEAGVTVLENELVSLNRGGSILTILGINDPKFTPVEDSLTKLAPQAQGYSILLSHRPELISCYADAGINLVFCGHAHGGQFRLPFIGGLLAPHQGWFPAYDAGLYTVADTNMVVSRGLGNSSFPFRLNNRPELILAELKTSA